MPQIARLARVKLCLCAAFMMLAGAATGDEPSTLRIGLLPGESAPTVLRMNEALRAHLESVLGLPIRLDVGMTYAATGEALRFGRIDIAYLGPVTYVLQSERTQLVPFAKPSHANVGPQFEAVIIVPTDSSAQTLRDLTGTNIAFGDPASTSGTWVPQFELLQAGLSAGRDYLPQSLGAHDAVALAVANRRVAAGGLSRPIFERLLQRGVIDGSAVRVLAYSRAIPEYAFTFRPGLDAKQRERIAAAFLSIDDPKILSVFNAERFLPAADADFAPVRLWVSELKADRAAN